MNGVGLPPLRRPRDCVSADWPRHTTITWVERRYGYAIARACAGHTDTASAPTATLIRARLAEVAEARLRRRFRRARAGRAPFHHISPRSPAGALELNHLRPYR